MRTTASSRNWTLILFVGAGAGLIYDIFFSEVRRPLAAMIYGLFICAPIFSFTRGLILPGLDRRLRRLPFPIYEPLTIGLCVISIVASSIVAGTLMWLAGIIGGPFREVLQVPLPVILYSLLISAVTVFILRMSDLIGRRTFVNFMLGRYHRPVLEERIFLFVDIVGSTHFAETHGDLRAQSYLGRFFATLAEPVRRCQGTIDDYVGDLAIITWPMARGVAGARCIACVFAIRDEIEREAKSWRGEFGTVPRFRAALHGGPAVTAEIGVDRHKIAYFGDTVNSTARLEQLSRNLDRPVLISKALLDRVETLPRGVAAVDLGAHDIRGRDGSIEVAALVDAKRPADVPMVA